MTNVYLRYAGIIIWVFAFSILTGCTWLKSDAKEEDALSEPIVAPIANFTHAVNEGKAPLEVSFLDVSAPGSASISTWHWDFGNGDTSNQQNPNYTYSTPGIYTVALTVTTADGNDTLSLNNAIEVLPNDVVVTLTVVDVNGKLIDDVNVASSILDIQNQIMTDKGIELSFRPSEAPVLISVSKSGYLSGYVYADFMGVDTTHAVTMLERAAPITVDLTLGGTYVGENGILVDFSGSSFAKPDGSIAVGDGQLYITAVDTSERRTLNAFPGGFLGTQDDAASFDELFSYGVADITFEQGGETLALIEGEHATLTLPLYASKDLIGDDLNSGDIIPLWYLNEETGIWHYESDGVVSLNPISPTGLSMIADTSHFTTFNADVNPIPVGGSSGNGSPTGALACLLDLELIGGEVGKNYLYTLEYLNPLQPSSRRSRRWSYDGSHLKHYIARGFSIRADVSDGTIAGSATFSCGLDDTVYAQIELSETAPQFRYFDVESIPQFTLNSNNLYEIRSNILRVGAYFINADVATFTSDLFASPITLVSDVYSDVIYSQDQQASATIVATITQEQNTDNVVATDDVNFIAQSPPISSYYYAYFDPATFTTILSWQRIEGADNISVFQLGNDPQASGTLLHAGSLLNFNDYEIPFVGDLKGYLRVEVSNQYGVEVTIVRISERGCPPFTDLCSSLPQ